MSVFQAFTGPSYTSQSVIGDSQRTVNWYTEILESQQGKNPRYALYPVPGVSVFSELPVGPIRGMHEINGRVFVVAATRLFEILDTGGYIERGSGMASDPNPATLCSNGDAGDQLFITSGGSGYLFNLTSSVFSGVLTGVTMGAFLDGYFLALDATTSTLKWSALEDGTSWDGTDVAQRNTGADRWIAMIVSDRLIHLFGNRTSETWYDSGGSPNPFEAIQEGFRQVGIIDSFGGCDAEGAPVFVGQSAAGRGVVYRKQGYDVARISNHAVEHAIQGYATISDVVSYPYQDQGHIFTVLSFPTARATWVYDSATQDWHERGYWNAPLMRYDASRQLWHVYAFNRHLVGDRDGSNIYTQSITTYRDVGNVAIRRLRRAPHLNRENRFLTFNQFTLDLETGVGLVSGLGVDPQLILRWSDDGGRTWGNDHQVSAGKIGEYSQRAVWRRLGRARDRVFELVCTDPVPWRIINAYLDASGAREERVA